MIGTLWGGLNLPFLTRATDLLGESFVGTFRSFPYSLEMGEIGNKVIGTVSFPELCKQVRFLSLAGSFPVSFRV